MEWLFFFFVEIGVYNSPSAQILINTFACEQLHLWFQLARSIGLPYLFSRTSYCGILFYVMFKHIVCSSCVLLPYFGAHSICVTICVKSGTSLLNPMLVLFSSSGLVYVTRKHSGLWEDRIENPGSKRETPMCSWVEIFDGHYCSLSQ